MAAEKIDALSLDITSQLNTDNLDKVIDKLSELGKALDKLKGKSVSVSLNQTANASNKLGGSFLNTAVKLTALIAVYRKFGKVAADGIANAMNYQKSLNMFTVSMGEYADTATKYGETVRNALGIDIAGWQKTQGIFQTLITGFGVTGDKAAYMSQNITQLSYDIASFYGITNEEAANKIKSALSGRLEPIRKLGYDLSQAKLVDIGQNPANYGKQTFAINKETGAIEANTVATDDNTKHKIVNFNQLTQQEKVQLRYIALMTQVTQVQGNYARALNDPANQMNVFKEQLNMTSRALGNVFIPFLNKALPYLTAFAQVAQQAFQSIANLFGFKLPDMKDRTDISKNVKPYNKVVKATGDAAKNAKKMKDYMLGIDELNVFNPNTGAGGAGGAGGGENSNLKNLKLPGYDFLGKAVENSIKKAKENIDKLFAEWKKHPIVFPFRLMVEGGKQLGAKLWEHILGMTPEELRAEADKHGRTVGDQFWISFKDSVGFVGSELWSIILGKTPEELKQEAEAHGTTVGSEFFNALAYKIGGQDIWEMLWGTPDEFAKKAMDAGNTVGEQFFLGLSKKVLEWTSTNPLISWLVELQTGKKIDDLIAGLEKKLAPKTQATRGEIAPSYVSFDTAKRIHEIQTGRQNTNTAKVDTATSKTFLNNSMTLANAKKEANTFISTYANTLNSQKDRVFGAANDGLFKPTVAGTNDNGNANIRLATTANGSTKAYNTALNTEANKTVAFNNMKSVAQRANAGAHACIKDFETTGENSTKGYIEGILKYLKETGDAGTAIGAVALEGLQKKLQTGSPSKAFAKLGMYSAQGFANGVKENAHYATDAVSGMAKKALNAFDTSIFADAKNLSDKIILNGTIAEPMANVKTNMPSTTGYSIGAANDNAMASLASNIYQAVVSGMSSVANSGSTGNDIKVVIDGKEVFKAVQTESRKRGVAIGNGAFSR